MNLRYIDWIWQVRGSVALADGQTSDEVFARLEPLFDQPGTTHERAGGRLTFRKKDPGAQDKMSVFDNGVLEIATAETGPLLRYWLNSRMLLFCFLLPLFFLGVSQLTIEVAKDLKPTPAEIAKEEAKKKKKAERELHWLDKALGAPVPEKPDKAKKDKKKQEDEKLTPTPSYVFAGFFAFLYLVGRLLEDWLIRRRIRQRLQGS